MHLTMLYGRLEMVIAEYYRYRVKYTRKFNSVEDAAKDMYWMNEEGEGWPTQIIDGDIVIWINPGPGEVSSSLAKLGNFKDTSWMME